MTETQKISINRVLIPLVGMACFLPFVSAAIALVAGLVLALTLENPYPTKKYTHQLLAWSVVGLGAGMNLQVVARVGLQGIGYTVVSISSVFLLGFLLRKVLKVDSETGVLITVGTAICGGSAIAAVTPVIRARPHAVSVALGTVFILNSVALLLFPPIGHLLHLTQREFGLWSALAIHDTSSVVGATLAYGKVAAEVGTTVKLARALWIVPVTFLFGFLHRNTVAEGGGAQPAKTKKPWFILGFLLAAAIVTWVPTLRGPGHIVEFVAQRSLVLTLFFIGLDLSKATLKQVGIKPFVLGVTLWILVAVATLCSVHVGWIH